MKAATINKWGDPGVFDIGTFEKPAPGPNQVQIQVICSSVNPVDYKQRKGNHKFILGSPFPIILGYDVSGIVTDIGSEVESFKIGDEIFGDLDNKYGTALAEYAVGQEHCFAPKPKKISFQEAAALPLAGLTALQGIRDKGKLKAGETIIINGASGGVGHLALQIAHILKGKTIVVASAKNVDFLKQFNPEKIVDYTSENIYNTGIKADIIFDVAGNLNFRKCLKLLNNNGRYVSTLPRPKIIWHKFISVFTKGKKPFTLLRKHNAKDMRQLAQWQEEGSIKPFINKTFSLEEIADAHRFAEKAGFTGKVVININ